MKYKDMIEEAKAKGLTSERTMWESVEALEEMLCLMKREHPEMFWKFMREQHGLMWKNHYSEDFAEHDVKHLKWKDKEGHEHEGEYWTMEQVKEATKSMTFPQGTNDCDKWVAFNVMYSDLHEDFTDAEILKIAYKFFFTDYDFDYTKGGKIWKYVSGLKM